MKLYLSIALLSVLTAALPISAQQTVPLTTSGSISLPTSSATATLPALITVADRSTFAAKQNALGFVPENLAMKNALNGYAGLDALGKLSWTRLTAIPIATSLVDGILPHANWVTFNAKQSALGYTAENIAKKNVAGGYAGLDLLAKFPWAQLSGVPALQSPLGFTPENTAKKNQPGGYAGLDTTGALPWIQISGVPTASATTFGCLKPSDFVLFAGKQDALGFIPENSAKKNVANGYAGLDANGKFPWTQLSGIPPITTSLGYTPENAANKGRANGYAALGVDGLVPAGQLPAAPAAPVSVVNEFYAVPASLTITLASSNVIASSVVGYLDGRRMAPGADFLVSGNVVTLISPAAAGVLAIFDYSHN